MFGGHQGIPVEDGLHLGTVTRVTAAGAFVEIAGLAPGFEYGPCRYPTHLTPDETTLTDGAHGHDFGSATTGDAGGHGHNPPTVADHPVHTHGIGSGSTGAATAGTAHTHPLGSGNSTAANADAQAHTVGNVPAVADHHHALPGTGVGGAHAHHFDPLAAGDTVLCGFLAGGHDDLVVIVRLT